MKKIYLLLGEGGYSSLDTNSQELANRDAIASQMSILISGYNAQGLQEPSRSSVFETAARSVLVDKYNELNGNKLSDQLKDQSKQHIQRANKSSSSATKTPEEEEADLAELLDKKFG